MYDATEDPYCYPRSTVLKNLPGLTNQIELDAFEAASTMQRADEPLPAGRLGVRHYQAIHRHLFQDVYAWAGKPRTVRMNKDGSAFCYPEHIDREMRSLFGDLKTKDHLRQTSPKQFADGAAQFLSTLNAIHPFREGNGRTQTLLLALLADQALHPLNLARLEPEAFLVAMVESFRGNVRPLTRELERLIA
jgi:cell filamentation protein